VGGLEANETVLIHSTGVGIAATQIAKSRGYASRRFVAERRLCWEPDSFHAPWVVGL
jgi:NADPH:quinone reductase-like Zn-dependent oxidoreductase